MRVPYPSPPWIAPRRLLIAAAATSGAAVATLFLVRTVPSWIVACGAAVWALLCGIVLCARSRRRGAAIATAIGVLLFALSVALGFALHHAAGWLPEVLIALLVAAAPAALVFTPLTAIVLRIDRAPAHDRADGALVAASAWIAVAAGALPLLGRLLVALEDARFGTGGLAWLVQGGALAAGAALAAIALGRDAGRLRFLARVRGGRLPAWEIAPRAAAAAPAAEGAPLRWLGRGDEDGALVHTPEGGAGPFRSARLAVPAAWIPLDPAGPARALRLRMILAAGLVLAHGAALGAIALEAVAHAEPLRGVVEVAVGGSHACARLASGGVVCWGRNFDGQIGGAAARRVPHPSAVAGLEDAARIAAGSDSTCALRRGGEIVCWGAVAGGARSPRPVALPAAAKRVAVGWDVACAILVGGELVCWEAGHAAARVDTGGERPLDVTIGDEPEELGVNAWHQRICVATRRGLRCVDQPASPETRVCCQPPWEPIRDELVAYEAHWGEPRCLRDQPPPDERRVATLVEGAVDLAGSSGSACAVREDGTVWCWGRYNDDGELGDGTARASAVPVEVRR
jgi:hypothetical protein